MSCPTLPYPALPPLVPPSAEVVELCRYLAPSPAEAQARQAAIDRIEEVVVSIWPKTRVEVFGSFATGARAWCGKVFGCGVMLGGREQGGGELWGAVVVAAWRALVPKGCTVAASSTNAGAAGLPSPLDCPLFYSLPTEFPRRPVPAHL